MEIQLKEAAFTTLAVTVTVSDCTFSGNSATRGGGIYNLWGTVTVGNSTFSGNNATKGGGIFNVWGSWDQSGGNVTVINSTFSGNTAGEGGAFSTLALILDKLTRFVANSSGRTARGRSRITAGTSFSVMTPARVLTVIQYLVPCKTTASHLYDGAQLWQPGD